MTAGGSGFDVFLSCPMAGARTEERYQELRAEVLRVVECLERECGLTVFYAGRHIETKAAFDESDFTVLVDIDALKRSRFFLLIYPDRVVSSVLVEAGIALALEKPAVYFVRDVKHLPFMLRHIDRVFQVRIYEYETADRILNLLGRHRTRLFEPLREAITPPVATAPTPAGATPTFPPDLRPDLRVGPYTLVRRVGAGANGVVWLAERRTSLTTTQVALKFPAAAPDAVAFRREAQLWVQASGHPNVLPVIEAEIYENLLVIVSPFLADGSLQAWLERRQGQPPPLGVAVELGRDILAGLAHLHGRRLVHRDLKPANVLMEGDHPRIADFGLARGLRGSDQTFSVGGTPAYMAPEAWEGERSELTDLWSAGVLLFELLTGQRPFPETDLDALRERIQGTAEIHIPATVPEPLAEVLRRALARDPTRRYPSAAAMADDLDEPFVPVA